MGEGVFIFFILGVVVIIGRYVIMANQKIEQRKKFIKNMKEYDKKINK